MSEIKTIGKINPADITAVSAGSKGVDAAKALSKQQLKDEKAVEKAAGGFEALILQEMFKSMWSTVETTGLMGEDSNAAQIYTDMFHQAVADSVSKGRGMGLKQFVKHELVSHELASKGVDPLTNQTVGPGVKKRLNEIG